MSKEKKYTKKQYMHYIIFIIIVLNSCSVTLSTINQFQKEFIIIGIGLLSVLYIKNNIKSVTILQFVWILFSLFMLTSSIISINRTGSILYSMMWVFLVFTIPVLAKENYVYTYIKILKIISIIITFSVLYQLIDNYYCYNNFWFLFSITKSFLYKMIEGDLYLGIYTGIAGEKADAAFWVLIGIVILFSELYSSVGRKTIKIPLLIAMYIALILTGKRTLLVLGVGVPIIQLCLSGISINKKVRIILVMISFALISLVILNSVYSEQLFVFEKFGYSGEEDVALNLRKEYWDVCIQMFKKSPIWGVGAAGFSAFLKYINADFYVMYAHNIYFEMLGELGIFGLLLFGLCIVYTGYCVFQLLYKKKLDNKQKQVIYFVIGFLISFCAYGLTGNVMYYTFQYTMLIMCVTCIQFVYKDIV